MTAADAKRWKALADGAGDEPKDKAVREIALAMIAQHSKGADETLGTAIRGRTRSIKSEHEVRNHLTEELQRAGCVLAVLALAHCRIQCDGHKVAIKAAPHLQATFRRRQVRSVIWRVLGHGTGCG